MKLSRTTVSIFIAAAVLLSAYIVGLVIRQARSGGRTPSQPTIRRAGELTPEERAKIKAAKAEQLKQNRNLTPEQQEQFKKDVARQLSPSQTLDANAPLDEKAAAERARAITRMRGQIQRSMPTADANSRRTTSSPNATDKASTPDANRPK